jgi:hypothetical protein
MHSKLPVYVVERQRELRGALLATTATCCAMLTLVQAAWTQLRSSSRPANDEHQQRNINNHNVILIVNTAITGYCCCLATSTQACQSVRKTPQPLKGTTTRHQAASP